MRVLVPVPLTLLVLLTACGVSEEEFLEEYVAASCDVLVDCEDAGISFVDATGCRTTYEGFVEADTDDCDYDPKAARKCLREMAEPTCKVLTSDRRGQCAQVYSGTVECVWKTRGT